MPEHSYKNPHSNVTHVDKVISYYNKQKLRNLEYIIRTKMFKIKGLSYEKGVAKFKYLNREILFKQHYLLEGYLLDTYLNDEYGWLNVKGKEVLDIGSCIGDTALYFATKGAKHVYTYEMDKELYNHVKTNIKLNKMSAKIFAFRGEVGDGTGTSTKFSDILKKVKGNDIILKMDIEGGEYPSVFSTESKELRRISQMVIEYHKGYLDLKEYLENCGFKVRVEKPNVGSFVNNKIYSGLMFVTRKSY